jgi:hypothetical protein
VAYLSQAEQIIAQAPWRPVLESGAGTPSTASLVTALQWLAAKQITHVAQQLQVRTRAHTAAHAHNTHHRTLRTSD